MRSGVVAAALAAGLVGCQGGSGLRIPTGQEMTQTFTSGKPAEQIAGCISDGWMARDRVARTNRTARGWAVIDGSMDGVYGRADIVSEGKQTVVTYSGPVAGYSRLFNLPDIPPCL